ncbi:MAG: phosphate ABC transporter substrate-binding protein PstS [Bdellovibrionales bacterium]
MTHVLLKLVATLALSFSTYARAETVMINGAGATFPYPIYSKWFSEYKKIDKDAQVNYNSIGSGGGIRQFLDKTVDFGASDAPMTEEQLSKAPEGVLHVPTVMGAVVLSYNIPEVKSSLKLTSEIIAEVYLGKITSWDDAKIVKENPGIKLPKLSIVPIYRSDGSGTTAIFTDYLSQAHPSWKTDVGQGTAVKWKTGLGGKGNEGVTGQIKQTPGSIGYIEFVYAETNKLPVATLKNKAGKYVTPTVKSVTSAASAALKNMPTDYRVSIVNADGKDSYPISGFTYVLIRKTMEKVKGKKIVALLNWVLTAGQGMAPALSYAPLPSSLVSKVKVSLKEVKLQ